MPMLTFLSAASPATRAATTAFVEAWKGGQQTFTLHTSGSTGTPKLLEVPRAYMEASAHATATALGLARGQAALICLNPAYIAGQMALVRGLELGWDMHVTEPSSNPWAELHTPIDHASFVPIQVEASLANATQRAKLAQMHSVLVGGAPVSLGLLDKVKSVPSVAIYQTFGMTETVSHFALRRLNGKQISEAYRVLDGFEIRLDARGCLAVAGPTTGGNWVQSNDVVELADKDTFIWLGRADFVINSGGLKLHPEQLEREMATWLAAVGFGGAYYLTAKPDDTLGQALVLMLESAAPLDVELLTHLLKKNLPAHHAPKQIRVQAAFARTATGKVIRGQLQF